MNRRFVKQQVIAKYSNQATFDIEPTADTLSLVKDALRAGRRLWRPGFRYAKAGVVLLDLARPQERPADFFPSIDIEKRARLMSALDSVNTRYGNRTLRPACAGLTQGWSMKRQKLSPRYTTVFDEVMLASAR